VLCAAKALGIPAKREKPNAITFKVKLGAGKELQTACILIDSSATANFMDQYWVKKCRLQNAGSPRQVKAINGHRVLSYGNHQLKIQARDKKREVRTQLQAFKVVDLDGYDAILG
jgi:hypothetical protein